MAIAKIFNLVYFLSNMFHPILILISASECEYEEPAYNVQRGVAAAGWATGATSLQCSLPISYQARSLRCKSAVGERNVMGFGYLIGRGRRTLPKRV